MPRFAANLSLLFTEVPFLDRFARAAAAGFRAVEFLFPYAWDAHEIRAQLDRHGLQLVLHNLPPGDWEAGDRGMACDPQRVDEFRAGGLTIDDMEIVSQRLVEAGASAIHCSAGWGVGPSFAKVLEPMSTQEGWRIPYAERIRKATGVPVTAVRLAALATLSSHKNAPAMARPPAT